MCKVIAVANQKGGCSKTSVVANLGIGLALTGKKVLLIDSDPQGSLTASLGFPDPDEMPLTLSGIEVSLANTMSREMILKEYIEMVRDRYDYILIDCMPSLGVMTINALVAADRVLVPVQSSYLSVKGLQMLLKTIAVVKKRLNKQLEIEGILITMVDYRTNYAKDITAMLRDSYGMDEDIGVLQTFIPFSVKIQEASSEGVSIFRYAPKCKVAESFSNLTKEVLGE